MYFTNRAPAFSSRVMPPLYLTVGELGSSLKQVLQFVAGKCTHYETGQEKLPIPRWLHPVPPDLYSPQGRLPLLVPSVPQDCGIWASCLEAGLELLFQGCYKQQHLICTPPRRGPFLGPYSPVVLPCHPNFTHSQCCISKCSTVSSISDHALKENH